MVKQNGLYLWQKHDRNISRFRRLSSEGDKWYAEDMSAFKHGTAMLGPEHIQILHADIADFHSFIPL